VMCLVPSEKPRQIGVHGLCFLAFGPIVENLWTFKVLISYKNLKFIFVYILVVATTQGILGSSK